MKTRAARHAPRILFLLGDVARARNDNHERLPRAFRNIGWEVLEHPHESLRMLAGAVRFGDLAAEDLDLIWPLGFGAQGSFLDRMQLLDLLAPGQLVNTPRALTFLHAKYRWWQHMPETHAANDVDHLARVMAQGGDWVVKPAAGSHGRDVSVVRDGEDPRAVLERLIGSAPEGPRYCIVQRFLPDIASGETRALLAAGETIGCYLRAPQDGLHANLSLGAEPKACALAPAQAALVAELARDLRAEGVRFASVDLVGDRLMEVNVANPGGLATLQDLYGEDFAARAARAIARHQRAPRC